MFKKGEKIVYSSTGVCIVEEICEKELIRNQKRTYYKLRPIFQQNNTIYAPVDNENIFMRKIMSAEDAEKLILSLPEIREKSKNADFGNDDYRSMLSGHKTNDLIELTARIYEKKRNLSQNKRKLGFSEEKYMLLAENLLFGELSVALDIPLDEVETYIADKLKA